MSVSRRDFLVGCACCCLAGVADAASPPAGREAAVNIGPLARYAGDGIWDDFASDGFLLVRRTGGELQALSNVCSHKMGRIVPDGPQLRCTRHRGFFDLAGKPVAGPPDEPLRRLDIAVQPDGSAVVTSGPSSS